MPKLIRHSPRGQTIVGLIEPTDLAWVKPTADDVTIMFSRCDKANVQYHVTLTDADLKHVIHIMEIWRADAAGKARRAAQGAPEGA